MVWSCTLWSRRLSWLTLVCVAALCAACAPLPSQRAQSDPPIDAAITRGEVTLRSGPGPGYAPIARIPAGAPVLIIGHSGSYVALRVAGRRGWADMGSLSGRAPRVATTTTASTTPVRRTTRRSPSRRSGGFEALVPAEHRTTTTPTETSSGASRSVTVATSTPEEPAEPAPQGSSDAGASISETVDDCTGTSCEEAPRGVVVAPEL